MPNEIQAFLQLLQHQIIVVVHVVDRNRRERALTGTDHRHRAAVGVTEKLLPEAVEEYGYRSTVEQVEIRLTFAVGQGSGVGVEHARIRERHVETKE